MIMIMDNENKFFFLFILTEKSDDENGQHDDNRLLDARSALRGTPCKSMYNTAVCEPPPLVDARAGELFACGRKTRTASRIVVVASVVRDCGTDRIYCFIHRFDRCAGRRRDGREANCLGNDVDAAACGPKRGDPNVHNTIVSRTALIIKRMVRTPQTHNAHTHAHTNTHIHTLARAPSVGASWAGGVAERRVGRTRDVGGGRVVRGLTHAYQPICDTTRAGPPPCDSRTRTRAKHLPLPPVSVGPCGDAYIVVYTTAAVASTGRPVQCIQHEPRAGPPYHRPSLARSFSSPLVESSRHRHRRL